MQIQQEIFTSIDGEKISLAGNQSKPTLINLWFIQCPGCIAEMPALNRLKEKYEDKVNFISLTFEQEDDVRKFLKK
ncbi:TlpA disulfide reductase family protein [uncultured Winogradskyella sp.]|uniref:TlpA family protein disulfide reductase n=1 Tax=uncultured Winogradskyella sp. TaxID=395353 RepID=UPI0030DB8EA7|tara:strand:+ start:49989 stop:50216 length:228 start_codon:yes stop_codon:yes gene_type:complete